MLILIRSITVRHALIGRPVAKHLCYLQIAIGDVRYHLVIINVFYCMVPTLRTSATTWPGRTCGASLLLL